MSESNKYFWLKLKRDFFKRHDIQIIEAMPNGKDYILFYLKLLCESVDHEGNLRFSDQIPYNDQMLATITNTNIDIVRSAIKIFSELKMMELLDDGTLFMNETQKILGCETEWARKKREYRQGQIEDKKGQCPPIVRQEIEIEKEIELEKDILNTNTLPQDAAEPLPEEKNESAERINYQEIVDEYNSTCKSFPKVTALSDARKKAIKARLKIYSLDDFKKMFKLAEESDFLKGNNNRNWTATFDWMIKDSNMAKILDGNYNVKTNQPNNGYSPPPKQNSFCNFKQNEIDYEALAKKVYAN